MSVSFVLKVKRISLSFRHVYVNMQIADTVIDQPIDLAMLLALRNHLGYVPLFRSTAGLYLSNRQRAIANKADQFPISVTAHGEDGLILSFPACYQSLFPAQLKSKDRHITLTLSWSNLNRAIESIYAELQKQIEPRKAYRFDADFEQELNTWLDIQHYLDSIHVRLVDYAELMEIKKDPHMVKASQYGGLVKSPRVAASTSDC